MPQIRQFRATVLGNRPQAEGIYELVFAPSPAIRAAQPGQFVEIAINDTLEPMLRRPFSICSVEPEGAWSVVYRAQGRGTDLLSRTSPGTQLDVLGPLGRGFTLPSKDLSGAVALVGGGVGVPPMVFLAQALRQVGINPIVLCGFASAKITVCMDHFADLGIPVSIATDDGSLGRHGLVTELLAETPKLARIYACGPTGMLRAVAGYCMQQQISCQVSLEEKMACGVGACLSCVCPVRKDGESSWKWQRVCKEGPVFDGAEVAFDAMR